MRIDQDDFFGNATEEQMMNNNFDVSVNKKKNLYFQDKLDELRQIQGKINDDLYIQKFQEGFIKGKELAIVESQIDFKIIQFKIQNKDIKKLVQLKERLKQDNKKVEEIKQEIIKIE